jgi:lipoate---protein ligase
MKKNTNKLTECWRLLDTPPMSAAENMCLDYVLAEQKGEEQSPNTIRFLQFDPPTVLVGHHQFVEEEVRADYCQDNNIDINRRITGGGAIYFDIGQLGWEIYASRSFFNLTFPVLSLYERLCVPIVKSLAELGLEHAAFRPRNDIEIEGRKISGTGGAVFGDSFIFQGTILIDFNIEAMLKALRVPTEKLKQKGLNSIKERVTSIKRELGYLPDLVNLKKLITTNFENHLQITLVPASLTPQEQELFDQKIAYFNSPKWINKVYKKDAYQRRHSLCE